MDKHLILLALAILIPGLVFVAVRWPHGIYKTFSQHVAPKKSSIYFYCTLFIIVLPILYIFFAEYLIPLLGLPSNTFILIALSCIAQLGCTLVPETGGLKTKLHLILAGASALLLLAVLLLIATNSNVTDFDKVIVITSTFLMSATVVAVVFWKKTRLPALLLQTSYFTLFFIAIITVTY